MTRVSPDSMGIVLADLIINEAEVDQVVDVWYEASIKCHDFISESFWQANRKVMARLYIPNSETTVAKQGDQTVGFMSLVGNNLASIFVHPAFQGQGIGHQLLQEAFNKRSELQLNVYSKNTAAIDFYKRYGFVEVLEGIDEHTGEPALTMKWQTLKDVPESIAS